jgi:hypothetical protein
MCYVFERNEGESRTNRAVRVNFVMSFFTPTAANVWSSIFLYVLVKKSLNKSLLENELQR